SKESSSVAANLYQKAIESKTKKILNKKKSKKTSAQEQIKTIFYNNDVVILNEINFTINSYSYSFVYNQLHSNTEKLCLLVVVKAIDISKVLQSAYRTIDNFSQSLPCEWAVSK
ncbi:24031_t:CDS:2, partial [Gigaspora margarita]